MGHFLDVAYRILSEVEIPLTPEEITEMGLNGQLLKTRGKTPIESMRARLSTVILDKKENSRFIRTAAGKFGLRTWIGRESLYIAPRFKKSLLEEDIVVFPAKSLKKYVPGPGLYTTPPRERTQLIAELRPMKRRLAEESYEVIQLVSAFIVRYDEKYLTYKRTKRLPESRLHGYYSIPFGGHLNENDILPMFDIFDSKVAFLVLYREFREEIVLPDKKIPNISYKGLLYDNRYEVSCQHLGVVYDVYLDSPKFWIGERGFLMDSKFETLNEIKTRINEFENWSWIIVDHEEERLKT